MQKAVSQKLAAVVIVLFAMLVVVPALASAQSIWKKLKDQVTEQQKQQQQKQQSQQQQRQQPQTNTRQQQPNNADTGPIVPPAGTKIDEKPLAPVASGAKFYISPHGVHVATEENSGSRMVVFYDGVEGPKFDRFLSSDGGGGVVFSPDGNRYAYCAGLGNEVVVMVDGKELARTSEPAPSAGAGQLCDKLGFTSNSKHVYYLSHVWPPTGTPYTRFVFDGVAGPPGGWAEKSPAPVFSPDGDHFAYIWIDPDTSRNKPWMLVVDGKPAPYRAGDPQWSADSKHLYTTQLVPVAGRGNVKELLLDGKPLMRANDIELFIPPVGNMVVAKITAGGGPQGQQQFLVIDGKKVPGSEITGVGRGPNISTVTISPDGKHYAARATGTNGQSFVFWDGKRGLEYQKVDDLAFTADSSKITYTTFTNNKPYVVYGDQESNPCQPGFKRVNNTTTATLVIAPVGSSAGTLCGLTGGAPTLFLNGKTQPIVGTGANDLRFTPDGQHYVYVAGLQGGGWRLVIDGVEQEASNLPGPSVNQGMQYVFSPDSQHMAVYSQPPKPTGDYSRGLFVDGKYVTIGNVSQLYRLEFSPDGNHLAWAESVPSKQALRIVIDGKPILETEEAVGGNSDEPWWEFSPDGNLVILGQDDKAIKRITITPSPSTNVDSLLAMAH